MKKGVVPVSVLNKTYKDPTFIGSGCFGVVLRVAHKKRGDVVALKIQEFDGAAMQEVEMLSKLNPISPVFTKMHQAFLCRKLPASWVKAAATKADYLTKCTCCVVIEMEYNPYTFAKAKIPNRRRFLYELIEAIMLARRKLGVFALNDFHIGNLMVDGKWRPKLIDFGYATCSEEILEQDGNDDQFASYTDSGGHQEGKNDFIRLQTILTQKGWDVSWLDLSAAKNAKANDWKVLEDILNQDFFKN